MENSGSDRGPERPSRSEDEPPQLRSDEEGVRIRFRRYDSVSSLSSDDVNEVVRSNTEVIPPDSSDDVNEVVRSNTEVIPPDSSLLLRERRSSFEFLPPAISELRVVLLGNSWSQRSSVGNFILNETKFNTEEEPQNCLRVRGQLKEKEIVLINTPDLLHPNIPENKLIEHVNKCVRLCDPGPHVFLLVLQPEDFTEEHKLKLCRVLQRFSDRSFDHSLVLMSTPREESPGFMEEYRQHPPLKDLIRRCQYRFLWQKNLELPELLTRLGQIVKENNGEHLSPRGSI